MSNQAQREMTLEQWVEGLPPGHRARSELAALKREIALKADYIKRLEGGQVKVENAEEMKYPETDPATYKSWVKAARQVLILQELEKLLMFVRKHPICGLEVGKIRVVCFTPFGGPNLFNRKVWLFMNEIEAYNDGTVDEEALALEWKLSGLKRP